jgi:phospholipid transport system substrate-binding protein
MFSHPMSRLTRAAAVELDRRRLLGFVLLAALPAAAYGADPAAADASATVARFYDGLLADMKAGRKVDFQRRFAILAPVIDQVFDLQTVLAVSVGPRWAGLAPDEQDRLLGAFRRYTVASYVASFDSYAGQTLSVLPEPRPAGGGQVVVQTRIVTTSGEATKLDYVLKQTPSGWKIVDVLADGAISRVAVQRSDFRGVLANGGGDALLASLLRKTSDLSGGNLA